MFDHDDPEKSSFPMRHRRWIVYHNIYVIRGIIKKNGLDLDMWWLGLI